MLSSKPWRVEAVIQLIAGVLACLCLGALTVGILRKAGVPGFHTTDSFGSVLISTLSFQGTAWILGLVFLWQHHVRLREILGLESPRWFKSVLLAMGVLVLAFPLVLGLQQLSVLAMQRLGWTPEDQRAVDLLAGTHSGWLRAYLALFAMVLAPVAEEFIFRGVLYPFIKQLGRPRLAWLGVSFLFAAIHVNLPTLLPLFALALLFTWLYEKTDCLLAPIAAHSLFNTANLVILYLQTR